MSHPGQRRRGEGGCGTHAHTYSTFADVPLLYETPEHVRAAVAVRWLVKRLLAKAVPMAGWGLVRDRRHVPRSAAEPFTPEFHREAATQDAPRDDDNNIITRPTLRDLGAVRVHNCAAAAAATVVLLLLLLDVLAVLLVVDRSLAHSRIPSPRTVFVVFVPYGVQQQRRNVV